MSNKSRQPKVEKAYPGPSRYADATTISKVGVKRVETVPVEEESVPEPQIAPEVEPLS